MLELDNQMLMNYTRHDASHRHVSIRVLSLWLLYSSVSCEQLGSFAYGPYNVTSHYCTSSFDSCPYFDFLLNVHTICTLEIQLTDVESNDNE